MNTKEDLYNADFYSVFFDYNEKEKKIVNAKKSLDNLIGGWSVATFLSPLLGFYIGGAITFAITLTSLVLLIITGTIMPKILDKKQDKLSRNENLIKLLYSENFHKMLFPYLNNLVEKYPEHFMREEKFNGNIVMVDTTKKLKTLLITEYTPENLLMIKNELQKIDDKAIRIEKQKALYAYEKEIGVEVSLNPVFPTNKEVGLENELVKML